MAEFSVIIAEDEKLIRNGILKSIDWASLNAEVTGLAKNGVEAAGLIQEKKPDILLTDIKMAGGNGLDLIKNARFHAPDIKVVIISGYNNFEYAQQAIKLGVKDYILKPIDIEKLRGIIEKLTFEIQQERSDRNDIKKLEDFYNDNKQILINEFFRELLFGVISEKDLDKLLPAYGFEQKSAFYFPMILYTEIKNPIEWASLKTELTEVIKPSLTRWSLTIDSLFLMPNEIFYTDITLVLSSTNFTYDLNRLLPDIKSAIEQLSEISLLAMGMGEITGKLQELSLSYQKAKTHAMFSMISGLNAKGVSPDSSEYALPVNIYETTRNLHTILKQKDKQKLEEFILPIEKEISDNSIGIEHKRTLLRNLFVCVLSAGDELGIPVREFFPDLMALFRYINLKTIQELLTKIRWACEMIIGQQQTREERAGVNLMDRAKSFIIENYSDPLLSLETVSNYLSLTPAYFSRLYKQAHGTSYIETLTKLRLDRAVKYLKDNPEMKISAISANVGYSTPSYFNYIFKKNFGQSPKDYRINLTNS
ncbi:MAG: response regulator [Spirochaetales bacterium]|uniref:Response regulator n=1 Tax=Candidatus Thalassospirochaeta sargassi TaxID=3119039 RepID=A0AAJ1MLC3_9SPIO|nr:response regulator [Spirochaetales bacterium]